MTRLKKYAPGFFLATLLALIGNGLAGFVPNNLIAGGAFALLMGIAINPALSGYSIFQPGIRLVSKQVLRLSIILMGLTLSFSQVLEVGKFSLIVMSFTLACAFGVGYVLGKLFNMDWKLSGLISAGTGICGGSAIAAIAPTIDAKDKDIAYAISIIFIFDVVMIILFPLAGRFFGMTDIGFGLWTGTAVNDTSAVVAAGYAFSDAAGNYAVIVKLTRTLSIIPVVLVFSYIHARQIGKSSLQEVEKEMSQVSIKQIFPFFILLFLVMVGIKSTGFVPDKISAHTGEVSKFLMVMSLGAIGLRTNFKEISRAGLKPIFHGVTVSIIVVVVSFWVQWWLGQL